MFSISTATCIAEPRTVAELGSLFSRDEVRNGALILVARNDATLSALLSIGAVTKTSDLDFFRSRFTVLEPLAIVAAVASINALLSRLEAAPQLALQPFVIRYVDGTDHWPYEASQVVEAINSAIVVTPPNSISSEDSLFLCDVFSYLKSVLHLLKGANESGNKIVFARLTELYEKVLSADAAASATHGTTR